MTFTVGGPNGPPVFRGIEQRVSAEPSPCRLMKETSMKPAVASFRFIHVRVLALGHLETYKAYPPLQAPESYNLSGILEPDEESQYGESRGRIGA